MNSQQKSQDWAETLLIWLNESSKEYRYWDQLYQAVEHRHPVRVYIDYRISKQQIRLRRDLALERFINPPAAKPAG